MESLDKQVSAFGKLMELIEKHGWIKTTLTFIVYGAAMYFITTFAINDGFHIITQKNNVEQQEIHDEAMSQRIDAAPKINEIMNVIIKDLHCDRVFVLEMHNGTNNTSGLPFVYAEMTYSQCADGIEYIDDDYSSLNMSRFTLPYYLFEHGDWVGTTSDLMEIDRKIAVRMISNGAEYMGIVTLQGADRELGFFGVSYNFGSTPMDKGIILRRLYADAQKISVLIDSKR